MDVERRRSTVEPAVDLRVAFLPRDDVCLGTGEVAVGVVVIGLDRFVVGRFLKQHPVGYCQLTTIFCRPSDHCSSSNNNNNNNALTDVHLKVTS